MPLFMLLAGSSAYFSLSKRTAIAFARERVQRILIPLILGILILIPPQVYVERLSNNQFNGSFFDFYPHFFQGVYPAGNFSWHHLWFLVYLFVYSILGLPLLTLLKSNRGETIISKISSITANKWGLLLFALPLLVGHFGLKWRFPQTNSLVSDWFSHSQLFTVFVYGFIFMRSEEIQQTLKRYWKTYFLMALILYCLLLSLF